MIKPVFIFLLVLLTVSCSESYTPKKKAYLQLNYPVNRYKQVNGKCPYQFKISKYATFKTSKDCWSVITYPKLKASLHITYRKVNNNLNEILREVEKLTYKHTIKADEIPMALPYENYEKKVFGRVNNVVGNVASNLQFMATDSLNNVIAGALYFKVKPNYDSILPAIKYIEKDVKHLIETLEWKNK